MADEKISAMPDIGKHHGSDLVPVARVGDPTNYSAAVDAIAAFVSAASIPAGTTADLLGATGTAGAAGLVDLGAVLSLTLGVLNVRSATSADLGAVSIGANIAISGGSISLNSADVSGALGYTPLTDLLASDMVRAFESAGVEFIAQNGGGPGVRLRDRID